MEEGTSTQESLIETLVGEGKKFKDIEALARGKLEADVFIKRLQDENKLFRELLESEDHTATLDNITDQVKKRAQSNMQTDNSATTTQNDEPSTEQQSANQQTKNLSEEDVMRLVQLARQKEVEAGNVKSFNETAKKAFGDGADETVTERAKELGLSVESIMDLAKTSPQAALRILGISSNSRSGNPSVHSNVNTEAMLNNSQKTGVRNAAYYEKLKQEMGIRKFVMDKNIQIQMHKDMIQLGDAWDS